MNVTLKRHRIFTMISAPARFNKNAHESPETRTPDQNVWSGNLRTKIDERKCFGRDNQFMEQHDSWKPQTCLEKEERKSWSGVGDKTAEVSQNEGAGVSTKSEHKE